MNYSMEELLPLTARLADRYTSKESSSIPYETAAQLMEAVLYCIREHEHPSGTESLPAAQNISAETAYRSGYECLLKKVTDTLHTYEAVTQNFCDYGCQNYKATILDGMPEFFVHYDAEFNPQDHILTLDYPAMLPEHDLCGIDLIHTYLNKILAEKKYLDFFSGQAIQKVLAHIQADYASLYYDNICSPVLLQSIGCVIADRPLSELELGAVDCQNISRYFRQDDLDKTESKIKKIIRLILQQTGMSRSEQLYFEQAARDYAVRIHHGIQCGNLPFNH